jgi:hypothetical protein
MVLPGNTGCFFGKGDHHGQVGIKIIERAA